MRRASITSLEESLRPSRKLKGALIGAAAGAALAVGLGLATGSDCNSNPNEFLSFSFCYSRANMVAFLAVLLVPGGGVTGGLIGRERWRKLPLDRIRVGLTPTRGRGIGA